VRVSDCCAPSSALCFSPSPFAQIGNLVIQNCVRELSIENRQWEIEDGLDARRSDFGLRPSEFTAVLRHPCPVKCAATSLGPWSVPCEMSPRISPGPWSRSLVVSLSWSPVVSWSLLPRSKFDVRRSAFKVRSSRSSDSDLRPLISEISNLPSAIQRSVAFGRLDPPSSHG
jgi:hypothetical protein